MSRFRSFVLRPSIALPVDQVIFALTNFLPLFVLSRHVGPDEFGELALVFSIVAGITLLLRSWTGIPSLLGHAESTDAAARAAIRVGLVVSLLGASLLFVVLDDQPLMLAVVIVVGAPAAFGADAMRHAYMARANTKALLRLEAVWLVAELVLLALSFVSSESSAFLAAGSWTVGALAALALSRPTTGGKDVLDWYDRVKYEARSLAVDALANFVRNQGFLLAVAAIGGAALAGSYRLGIGILAPATMLIVGWRSHSVVRLRGEDSLSTRLTLITPPLLVGCIGLLAVAVTPSSLKAELAGNTDADALLTALAVVTLLASVDSFFQALLISQRRASVVARTRIVTAAIWIVGVWLVEPFDVGGVRTLVVSVAILSTVCWILAGTFTRADSSLAAAGEPMAIPNFSENPRVSHGR